MKVHATTLQTDKFEQSMYNCFVDCCIAPESETSEYLTFKQYHDHKHGKLNSKLYSRLEWEKDRTPSSKNDYNVPINVSELVAQDTLVRPRTEVQGTVYDSDASQTVEDESDADGSSGEDD